MSGQGKSLNLKVQVELNPTFESVTGSQSLRIE